MTLLRAAVGYSQKIAGILLELTKFPESTSEASLKVDYIDNLMKWIFALSLLNDC